MLAILKRRRRRVEAETRERCLQELSLLKAIDAHWNESDVLLRQQEAKVSGTSSRRAGGEVSRWG